MFVFLRKIINIFVYLFLKKKERKKKKGEKLIIQIISLIKDSFKFIS